MVVLSSESKEIERREVAFDATGRAEARFEVGQPARGI
jgi:hypothetical protein